MAFPNQYWVAPIFALLAETTQAEPASLKLSNLLSDHMIIQREQPIKIWGTTSAGETVKVSMADTTSQATADDDGKWSVELPATKAGGPYEITVADSDETTTIKDVLIGDIWVCGGQSNMDWTLKRLGAEETIRQAANPNIRLYKVPRNKAITPLETLEPGSQWQKLSPESVAEVSAVGYYFGTEVQKEIDVPVGLIHSAWGGTRVEWWTPAAGLGSIDYFADELKDVKDGVSDEDLKKRQRREMTQWNNELDKKDPGIEEGSPAWAKHDLKISEWETIMLPGMLEDNGLADYDGTIWFRRTFELTEDQAKKAARITFCADDVDTTYMNEKQVGNNSNTAKQRTYKIEPGVLVAGENTIVIRLLDIASNGGICGKSDDLKLLLGPGKNADEISLTGEWRFEKGTSLEGMSPRPKITGNHRVTLHYNAMIAPLTKLPIRGVVWYQGEGNARNYLAPLYAETLTNMITEWRKAWGLGDFPFIQVQLASYLAITAEPQEVSDWASLREAQADVTRMNKVGMASAIDLGDEKNIHPPNKLDVGKRLALNALAIEYGKGVEHSGPTYASHEVDGDKIIVTFTHADGLKTSGPEELKAFAIAGDDGEFAWADGEIRGNSVILTSDKVKNPIHVRYGWANYSTGNLYNSAGLPANPFRTNR